MQTDFGYVFPDLAEFPEEQDYYALGGDLRPEFLIAAYRKGIFPWPDKTLDQVLWASPAQRGIIRFSDLKISKSLKKFVKKCDFHVSIDFCFEDVISMCRAVPRAGQDGTWITAELERAYVKFHKLGFAHSIEVWSQHRLVGGLYGVTVDGLFFAESMFHIESNASKFAVLKVIETLQAQGLEWMDIQMLTPVTEALGGSAIPRAEFLDLLRHSKNPGRILLQEKTQI